MSVYVCGGKIFGNIRSFSSEPGMNIRASQGAGIRDGEIMVKSGSVFRKQAKLLWKEAKRLLELS